MHLLASRAQVPTGNSLSAFVRAERQGGMKKGKTGQWRRKLPDNGQQFPGPTCMFGEFVHPGSEATLTVQETLRAKPLKNRYDSPSRNFVERSEIARGRKPGTRLQTPVQHCLTTLFMEPARRANLLGFLTRISSKGVVRFAVEAPLKYGTKHCTKMALALVPTSS
jgi:hypothetical protein